PVMVRTLLIFMINSHVREIHCLRYFPNATTQIDVLHIEEISFIEETYFLEQTRPDQQATTRKRRHYSRSCQVHPAKKIAIHLRAKNRTPQWPAKSAYQQVGRSWQKLTQTLLFPARIKNARHDEPNIRIALHELIESLKHFRAKTYVGIKNEMVFRCAGIFSNRDVMA